MLPENSGYKPPAMKMDQRISKGSSNEAMKVSLVIKVTKPGKHQSYANSS